MGRARDLKIEIFPYIEYNKQGKITYREWNNGDYEKFKYNQLTGTIFRKVHSNGKFEKYYYNKQGNQVYYEDSDGNHLICEWFNEDTKVIAKLQNGKWRKATYPTEMSRTIIEYEDSDGNYWNKDMNITCVFQNEIATFFRIPMQDKIKDSYSQAYQSEPSHLIQW